MQDNIHLFVRIVWRFSGQFFQQRCLGKKLDQGGGCHNTKGWNVARRRDEDDWWLLGMLLLWQLKYLHIPSRGLRFGGSGSLFCSLRGQQFQLRHFVVWVFRFLNFYQILISAFNDEYIKTVSSIIWKHIWNLINKKKIIIKIILFEDNVCKKKLNSKKICSTEINEFSKAFPPTQKD